MTLPTKKRLLKDRRVIEEINRHLWIENEKRGHDISFDQAASEWIEKYSKAWIEYHWSKHTSSTKRLKTSLKSSRKTKTLSKSSSS